MKKEELNPKERAFAEFYCGECLGNAEQSAIMAGYSRKYARGHAHEIIKRPRVKKYIEEITKATTTYRIATIEEIKAFWTEVMNDTNAKYRDRLRASELLARAAGEFDF